MLLKTLRALKWTAFALVALMSVVSFVPVAAQVYTSYSALDGSISAPSFAFNSAPTTGLSRDSLSTGAQMSVASTLVQRWLAAGAILAGQTRYALSAPPTINACGTATVTGTDTAMKVVITAGTPTSCVVNFANTWANAPFCYYNDQTTAGAEGFKVTSTTALVTVTAATTFTGQAANLGADTITIHCESN